MNPTVSKQWVFSHSVGLQLLEQPVPKLGDFDVLVSLKAASINYRDALITKGLYPFPMAPQFVLGSDGAGKVVAVGSRVTEFKVGDEVVTCFTQDNIYGSMTPKTMGTSLGGMLDGTFREHGVFIEHGLVAMPKNLNWQEASTLSCAALTAWNSLYGLKPVRSGDTVLVQGSGGVSMFALQFAIAAGATVIATTSSSEKAERLKHLGASHVVNYATTAEWGLAVKSLTHDEQGVDHIIEVGGPNSIRQSLNAIKIDGVISMVGFLGGQGSDDQPGMLETLMKICTVRGVVVGSRAQFVDMNRAIEANNIKPILDDSTFKLEQLKESLEYLWAGRHSGKVVIQINQESQ